MLRGGLLIDLFLDPDDGSDIFLETLVDFQWTTRCYIPEEIAIISTAVRPSTPTQSMTTFLTLNIITSICGVNRWEK
jgi:hypothetical protein